MKIGTHNGVFQADDVLAVAMLRMLYPGVEVIRTRDEALLAECFCVVDVGGVYDDDKQRYDHHQVGRAGARPNGILYSACGLVWKHWGEHILGLPLDATFEEQQHISNVAAIVDQRFVQTVDAIDNGQELVTGGIENFPGARSLSFSALISSLNPSWNEHDKNFDGAFMSAVGVAGLFLQRAIVSARGSATARECTLEAINKANENGYGPQRLPLVIELPHFCPWQEVVVEHTDVALYVVFPDEMGKFMVQCVPDKLGGFGKRKALPAAWGGLRGAELQKLTGVEDAIFCHPGLFICGAASLEGARRLAAMAVMAAR